MSRGQRSWRARIGRSSTACYANTPYSLPPLRRLLNTAPSLPFFISTFLPILGQGDSVLECINENSTCGIEASVVVKKPTYRGKNHTVDMAVPAFLYIFRIFISFFAAYFLRFEQIRTLLGVF